MQLFALSMGALFLVGAIFWLIRASIHLGRMEGMQHLRECWAGRLREAKRQCDETGDVDTRSGLVLAEIIEAEAFVEAAAKLGLKVHVANKA